MVKKLIAMAFAAALSLNVNVKANDTKEVEEIVQGLSNDQIALIVNELGSKDVSAMTPKQKKILKYLGFAVMGGSVIGMGYCTYKHMFPGDEVKKAEDIVNSLKEELKNLKAPADDAKDEDKKAHKEKREKLEAKIGRQEALHNALKDIQEANKPKE